METKILDTLDEFTRAYLVCALFTWDENAPSGDYEQSGRPEMLLPLFAVETLEKAKSDCEKFQADNRDLINAAIQCPGYDLERAGHDFWYTRNHHGVGFWDRDELTEFLQKELTKRAHAFRELDLYEGDDKQLYLS